MKGLHVHLLSLFTYYLVVTDIYAQVNLVPNGGFELYKSCPTNVGQFDSLSNWYSILGTPDYFNSCASYSTAPNCSVPKNFLGYQAPASGNAYAGLWVYDSGVPTYREYFGTQLTSPLIIGQKYYISFKVSLTLDYISNLACDKIGLKFSTVKHTQGNPSLTDNSSDVYATSIITDSLNWTTIFGSFIADSAYGFVEIGNFFDTPNTNYIVEWNTGGSNQSYYYTDDVCISTDSLFTLSWTATIRDRGDFEIKLYPNPSTGTVFVQAENFENCKISVLSIIGEEVKDVRIDYLDQSIEFTNSGIYIIDIITNSHHSFKKVVINK